MLLRGEGPFTNIHTELPRALEGRQLSLDWSGELGQNYRSLWTEPRVQLCWGRGLGSNLHLAGAPRAPGLRSLFQIGKPALIRDEPGQVHTQTTLSKLEQNCFNSCPSIGFCCLILISGTSAPLPCPMAGLILFSKVCFPENFLSFFSKKIFFQEMDTDYSDFTDLSRHTVMFNKHEQCPRELIHKRLLAFNWNPPSTPTPQPLAPSRNRNSGLCEAGSITEDSAKWKESWVDPEKRDALLCPTPLWHSEAFHFLSSIETLGQWRPNPCAGGWGLGVEKEGRIGRGGGLQQLILCYFSSFLPITLKRGWGNPVQLIMNDDITSGSPTGPASRPKRHWELDYLQFHFKLF